MKFSGGAGLPFFTFRFRATLARGSTTTRTPKVDAFVLRYLDAPNLRFAYNFSVRTRDDEEIAFYEALALQKINFPFNPEGDLAGPMEYVRITNGPTIVGIDDTGLRTLQMTVASPT